MGINISNTPKVRIEGFEPVISDSSKQMTAEPQPEQPVKAVQKSVFANAQDITEVSQTKMPTLLEILLDNPQKVNVIPYGSPDKPALKDTKILFNEFTTEVKVQRLGKRYIVDFQKKEAWVIDSRKRCTMMGLEEAKFCSNLFKKELPARQLNIIVSLLPDLEEIFTASKTEYSLSDLHFLLV